MTELSDVNSLEETADYLKITPDRLRRLAREKKIGSLKTGNRWTFPRSVIEAYVQANTVTATPPPPNPWGLTPAALRRINRGG